jgi:hypothetical protein
MEKIISILSDDWSYLQLAVRQFTFSKQACDAFVSGTEYSETDLEKMEAFTARFARVLDIYTQKILKTTDVLEGYGEGSLRDILGRCEKAGIISDAQSILKWRILRNEIAHDYIPSEQRRIFFEVQDVADALIESILVTQSHLVAAKWLAVNHGSSS